MTLIRKWQPKGAPSGLWMEAPFYDQLLASTGEKGCLSRDFEAHALWEYYGLAVAQFERAKNNIVAEDELSQVFDRTVARRIFEGVANKHGVKPMDMVKFWPLVERQVRALGGVDNLPGEYKFTFWGH